MLRNVPSRLAEQVPYQPCLSPIFLSSPHCLFPLAVLVQQSITADLCALLLEVIRLHVTDGKERNEYILNHKCKYNYFCVPSSE